MNYRPDRLRKRVVKPPVPLPASRREADALVIVLPVPPVALRPNGQHGHWSQVRQARAAAKGRAALTTLNLVCRGAVPVATGYTLTYFFHSTPWDDDNAIASCKSYLDGIAGAIGMNDRDLRFRALVRATDRQCPRVEITLHLEA